MLLPTVKTNTPLDHLIYACIVVCFLGQAFYFVGRSEAVFFDLTTLTLIAIKLYQILNVLLNQLRNQTFFFTNIGRHALMALPALGIQGICALLCIHNVSLLLTKHGIVI
jgi:hypothetical protein